MALNPKTINFAFHNGSFKEQVQDKRFKYLTPEQNMASQQ